MRVGWRGVIYCCKATLPQCRRGISVEAWRGTGPLAVRAPGLVVASRGVWLVSAAGRCVFRVNDFTGSVMGPPPGGPPGDPPGDPPGESPGWTLGADRSGTARNQLNATTCHDQPGRADRERTRATPRLNRYATSTLRECSHSL